jgi:outer membrane protein TolC
MKSLRLRLLTRLPGLALAGSLFAAGCSSGPRSVSFSQGINIQLGEKMESAAKTHTAAKPVEGETLPAPKSVGHVAESPKRVLPIALDTVLRLAEEQNVQVGIAREKLFESQADQRVANLSWLPNLEVGVNYFRHEGGIQDQDGRFLRSSFGSTWPGMEVKSTMNIQEVMYQKVNAERKVWQQQGELSRVNSETLLEASSTYIDLLTAHTSEAVLKSILAKEEDVLKWAEALLKQEKSAEILVETVKAQMSGHRQAVSQAKQSAEAASAKLAYLLGLGPDVQLVPADVTLQPVQLTNADLPTDALVNQALASGPGVQELEQMIAVIQNGLDMANGKAKYLPVFEVWMREGGFGAGKNSNMTWDNRWDACLGMHWNLTDLCKAHPRMESAQSKLQQAELSYRDLQGKLTAGVQEAQSTILGNRDVIKMSGEQVKHAETMHRLSDLRLKQRVEGSSTTEVLNAIRALEAANLSTISAVRAHNKAQVRLMVLMGAAGAGEGKKK